MKKVLLISLIVAVLALGGIGAAYATGMNFTNVQALSRGQAAIPQIDCTGVLYNLDGGAYPSVTVNAVQVRFNTTLVNAALSVSLRDSSGNELAYYACNGVNLPAGTFTGWLGLYGESGVISDLPSPENVYYVKVTAANNSAYNQTPITNYGPGTFTQP